MSPPAAYESSIVHPLPCGFPADPVSESKPSPTDTNGAKDVLHHAAEAYIATERLHQVERLVEGAGSRAAHYVPQTVANVVSTYWLGTGRSLSTTSAAKTTDCTTTAEHEIEQARLVKASISSGTRRIKQCANFPLALLSSLVITPAAFAISISSRPLDVRLRVFAALTVIYSLIAMATPTPTPTVIDLESEVDDLDFVLVVPPDTPDSELTPASVVSQDQPDGEVITAVVSSPPEPAPVAIKPQDAPEDEVAKDAHVLTAIPESPHESASPLVVSAQLPEPASPVASQDEAAPAVFNPSPEHTSISAIYVPCPSPQDESEGEAAHAVTPVPLVPESAHESASPVVVPAQPPKPTSAPVASQDEAEAAPVVVVNLSPERAPIPDPELEYVLDIRPSPHDDDLAEVACVLTPVPESPHESSPVVVSAQLPEPALASVVCQDEAAPVVVTISPEHEHVPASAEDEPAEAVASVVGATLAICGPALAPLAPDLPAPHDVEHTKADHDVDLPLEHVAGVVAEQEAGSTSSARVPAMQEAEGKVKSNEALVPPFTTDASTNLPAQTPPTSSEATNGSADRPYHPAELHPPNASYSSTFAQVTTTKGLGSTSPSLSMKEKGRIHGHFHKRTVSIASQSGSVNGRKKVGFFDKVRGEAKVILGKIEHKKEMVDAGKRILHGEV